MQRLRRVLAGLLVTLVVLTGCGNQAPAGGEEAIPEEWVALREAEELEVEAMGLWLKAHEQELSSPLQETVITDYGGALLLDSRNTETIYEGLLPYEKDASPAVQDFIALLRQEVETPLLEENFSVDTIDDRLARAAEVENMITGGDGTYHLSLRQFFTVYMEGALGGMGTIYNYADLEGKVSPLAWGAWKDANEAYAGTAVGEVIAMHLDALDQSQGQVNQEVFQQYLTNLRAYIQGVAERLEPQEVPKEENDA